MRTAAAKASPVAESKHSHFFNGAEFVNGLGKVTTNKFNCAPPLNRIFHMPQLYHRKLLEFSVWKLCRQPKEVSIGNFCRAFSPSKASLPLAANGKRIPPDKNCNRPAGNTMFTRFVVDKRGIHEIGGAKPASTMRTCDHPKSVRRQTAHTNFGNFIVPKPLEISRVIHSERFCRRPVKRLIAYRKIKGCGFFRNFECDLKGNVSLGSSSGMYAIGVGLAN